MKLPKTYFANLSTEKYREYLKLLPNMKHENTKIITMLIFTFAAMTFFGIFAINPTLTTIVDLQKQLADSKFLKEQLSTKITNLSSLQQQYTAIGPELPVLFEAIPQAPLAPYFVGQVEALAQASDLQIRTIRVSEVQLTTGAKDPKTGPVSSFTSTIEAQGTYEDILAFAEDLTNMNRIVTIESLGITKDKETNMLTVTVRAREYFKK